MCNGDFKHKRMLDEYFYYFFLPAFVLCLPNYAFQKAEPWESLPVMNHPVLKHSKVLLYH